MPTDPFASANSKVRRAALKAIEVQQTIGDYLSNDPITVDVVETGRTVSLTTRVRTPIPEDLPHLVGEWAHSLRSALDHAVYAHVDDRNAQKNCAFPGWRKERQPTPEQWQKAVERAVPGTRASGLRSMIKTLEPYPGGKDERLWDLTELDNADKHRVILDVTAAVATTQQVTRGQWITDRDLPLLEPADGIVFKVSTDHPFSHPFIKDPSLADAFTEIRLEVVYQSKDTQFVRDGGTLCTFSRGEWREVLDYEPRWQITFGEGHLLGRPVIPEIDTITREVTAVLDRLHR